MSQDESPPDAKKDLNLTGSLRALPARPAGESSEGERKAALLFDDSESGNTGSLPLVTADLAPDLARDKTAPEPDQVIQSYIEKQANENRRRFQRYDVSGDASEAEVKVDDRMRKAKITNVSVTGFWVETSKPYAFRTGVRVSIVLEPGVAETFTGRVVRQADRGMAVRLFTDDPTHDFRQQLVDRIVDVREPKPKFSIAEVGSDSIPASEPDQDLGALEKDWDIAAADFDDDEKHQAFITRCLKDQQVSFALEQYRRYRTQNPDDERVLRYLKQIGTILAFHSLQKQDVETEETGSKRTLQMIFLLVILVLGLLMGAKMVLKKLEAKAETPAVERINF